MTKTACIWDQAPSWPIPGNRGPWGFDFRSPVISLIGGDWKHSVHVVVEFVQHPSWSGTACQHVPPECKDFQVNEHIHLQSMHCAAFFNKESGMNGTFQLIFSRIKLLISLNLMF